MTPFDFNPFNLIFKIYNSFLIFQHFIPSWHIWVLELIPVVIGQKVGIHYGQVASPLPLSGGSWSMWRKPMLAWGDHANSTQENHKLDSFQNFLL